MAASESYLQGLYFDAATRASDSHRWAQRVQFLQICAAWTFLGDWILCSLTILILGFLHTHNLARQANAFHSIIALAITGGALTAFLLSQHQSPRALTSPSKFRETENVLRATVFSLLFVFFMDLSLGMHALGWRSVIGVIVIPALLISERRVALRLRQKLHTRGHGVIHAVLYVCAPRRGSAAADPAALVASGIKIVLTADDQNVTGPVQDQSANEPSGLTSWGEMVNPALLYATGCDLILIAGSRFATDKMAREIAAISSETGIPAAFIEAEGLVDDSAVGAPPHRLHPITSLACVPSARFVPLQRILDIAAAGVLLFLLGPLFLLIAIAVRIDSPGPCFFIQERVGKNGRRFQILKFRSMFVTAPPYAASPKRSSDPRITGVGRFLRRLGLDELPQLINVLKGDMALVGPRPEMPFLVECHRALHRERLTVKPGITGLWQLSSDRQHPIHENVHHDLYYIANGNLFLDLSILIHTLFRAVPGGI